MVFFGVKILKFFDEDPGSGMETVRIRDPGWKKVGSGIRDKHPGSAKLPRKPDLGPTFGGVLLDELRLLILDEPVVVAPVRVPDDVVQHHYPLE